MVAKAEKAAKQKEPFNLAKWAKSRDGQNYYSCIYYYSTLAFVRIYVFAIRRNGKIQFLQNEIRNTGRKASVCWMEELH